MRENLHKLANALGISTQFCDAGLNRREYDIGDDTIRFFAEKLGFKAGSDAEIENSFGKIFFPSFINKCIQGFFQTEPF